MFYEDWSFYFHHVEAISSDGVHFRTLGTLTTNGLDPNNPHRPGVTWPMTRRTVIGTPASTFPLVNPSTTGGVVERGQYGIELYRIPDASLLTGATPWQLLTTVDTNLTGYESNFLPGFLRDPYGNLMSARIPR